MTDLGHEQAIVVKAPGAVLMPHRISPLVRSIGLQRNRYLLRDCIAKGLLLVKALGEPTKQSGYSTGSATDIADEMLCRRNGKHAMTQVATRKTTMNRYASKSARASSPIFRSAGGILIAIFCLALASCSAIHARLTYEFNIDSDDRRVLYEPGTEDAAAEISATLNEAITQIEAAQYGKFKEASKIKIYVFDDMNRYRNFRYNTGGATFGGATTNEIFISHQRIRERLASDKCQSNICPETVAGIVLHELSHVHLRQYVGSWRYTSDIPSWFLEGLATLVSGGAGAGLSSEKEEKKSILAGSHFTPTDTGSIVQKPETVGDLEPNTFRFYRQSQMFVGFLRQTNPAAFQAALEGILAGRKFRTVWQSGYEADMADLWKAFKMDLQRPASSLQFNDRKFLSALSGPPSASWQTAAAGFVPAPEPTLPACHLS